MARRLPSARVSGSNGRCVGALRCLSLVSVVYGASVAFLLSYQVGFKENHEEGAVKQPEERTSGPTAAGKTVNEHEAGLLAGGFTLLYLFIYVKNHRVFYFITTQVNCNI